MPTFVKGDMWTAFGRTDLFLFTSNPVVNKRGQAVMGRGIALQVARRFPEAQLLFGSLLSNTNLPHTGVLGKFDDQLLGWFRVKDHFAQDAKPSIIQKSANLLSIVAPFYPRIDLNFPGIGNGKLSRDEVLPLLEVLPSNVNVWEFE